MRVVFILLILFSFSTAFSSDITELVGRKLNVKQKKTMHCPSHITIEDRVDGFHLVESGSFSQFGSFYRANLGWTDWNGVMFKERIKVDLSDDKKRLTRRKQRITQLINNVTPEPIELSTTIQIQKDKITFQRIRSGYIERNCEYSL